MVADTTHRSAYAALMTKWTRRIACCLQIQNVVLIQQRQAAALNHSFRGTREAGGPPRGPTGPTFPLASPGLNLLAGSAYWSSDSKSSGF